MCLETPYDPENKKVVLPESSKTISKYSEVLSTLANAKFILGAVFTFFNLAVDGVDKLDFFYLLLTFSIIYLVKEKASLLKKGAQEHSAEGFAHLIRTFKTLCFYLILLISVLFFSLNWNQETKLQVRQPPLLDAKFEKYAFLQDIPESAPAVIAVMVLISMFVVGFYKATKGLNAHLEELKKL